MPGPTHRNVEMALHIRPSVLPDNQKNGIIGYTAQETGPSHTSQMGRLFVWDYDQETLEKQRKQAKGSRRFGYITRTNGVSGPAIIQRSRIYITTQGKVHQEEV
jgi:hypothetical protein